MPKIDFNKNLNTYKDYRSKYNINRLKILTLIGNTVSYIYINQNKKFSSKDIDNLAVMTYGKTDKNLRKVIYTMLNNEIVKGKINDKLIDLLTSKGITPNNKIVSLLDKGEELVKSTNDALSLIRFYKEIDEENKIKLKETRTYDNFEKYKNDIPSTITQEKIGEININDIPINTNLTQENSNRNEGGMGETYTRTDDEERQE